MAEGGHKQATVDNTGMVSGRGRQVVSGFAGAAEVAVVVVVAAVAAAVAAAAVLLVAVPACLVFRYLVVLVGCRELLLWTFLLVDLCFGYLHWPRRWRETRLRPPSLLLAVRHQLQLSRPP